jgi:hypothetical protein
MQALTWYFFRETSINLLTMQGTSHFFQEGNWTETPEDHILQVLIIAWASFQIITICILIFFLTFRDGVSEGQFYQVLLYELDAIRKVN